MLGMLGTSELQFLTRASITSLADGCRFHKPCSSILLAIVNNVYLHIPLGSCEQSPVIFHFSQYLKS